MIGHLAESRHNSKTVTERLTEKVANTLYQLTKTARKRPEIGEIGNGKDNVTLLFLLYIDKENTCLDLSYLRRGQNPCRNGRCRPKTITDIEYW